MRPRTTKDSIIWPDLKIYQHSEGYRFSLDAIILSRLLKTRRTSSILEIGSGCGVVPLIISRLFRFKRYMGVEIQKGLFALSVKNLRCNRPKDRIEFLNSDIRSVSKKITGRFDIVLSNPPFYPKSGGRLSANPEENVARHEIKIDLDTLASLSSKALAGAGELYLLYPAERLSELLAAMKKYRLEPKLLLPIYSKYSQEAELVWLKAKKGGKPGLKFLPPIFLYDRHGQKTEKMLSFYSKDNDDLQRYYPEIFA